METKVCIRCNESKDTKQFYKGMNTCKVCFNLSTRAVTMSNIERIYDYLTDKCCAKCGEANPVVLDFHHEDPSNKIERVANMKTRSWAILLEEIKKCSILCSNCHRIVHSVIGYGSGRRRVSKPLLGTTKVCYRCKQPKDVSLFYKDLATCTDCVSAISKAGYVKRSMLVNDYKSDHGCKHCDEKDYRVLDFHHRDPSTKLNKVAAIRDCSWSKVKSEIDKCDIICSNCHRKEHSANWYIPNKEVNN